VPFLSFFVIKNPLDTRQLAGGRKAGSPKAKTLQGMKNHGKKMGWQ
jgi:hypothetical protein